MNIFSYAGSAGGLFVVEHTVCAASVNTCLSNIEITPALHLAISVSVPLSESSQAVNTPLLS